MTAEVAVTGTGQVRRKLRYMPGLEGLRGFAIIVELIAHLGLFVMSWSHPYLMPGGLTIMSVFFVLSGFFITVLLLQDHDRHGAIDFRRFWWGRARRLFPPLFLVLIAHWLVALYYRRPLGPEWRDNLWALSNTMNYRYAVTGDTALDRAEFVIMWSLSLEVQFYLIWPVLIALLLRFARSLEKIIGVFLVIAAASTAVRTAQFLAWDDWLAVYFRFEGRLDAFCIGGILAFLWYHEKLPVRLIRRLAWPAWILTIISFWVLRIWTGWTYTWGLVLFNVAAFLIVASAADDEFAISRWLSGRFMRLAGRVSYSFYLIHIQVYMWVVFERRYLPMWQQVTLALGGTLVFGTIGYLVAERPFISQRRSRVLGRARPKAAVG